MSIRPALSNFSNHRTMHSAYLRHAAEAHSPDNGVAPAIIDIGSSAAELDGFDSSWHDRPASIDPVNSGVEVEGFDPSWHDGPSEVNDPVPTQYPGGKDSSSSPWQLLTGTAVRSPSEAPSNAPTVLSMDTGSSFGQVDTSVSSTPLAVSTKRDSGFAPIFSGGTVSPQSASRHQPPAPPRLARFATPALKVNMNAPWSTSAAVWTGSVGL